MASSTTSTTLYPLQIGAVGVEPGVWLLQAPYTNAEVQAPGFLNGSAGMSSPKPKNGDFVLCVATDGSEYYTIEIDSSGYNLIPSANSPVEFAYQNTLFGAQNGNDLNAGLNDFQPKRTMQGLFNAITSPGIWVINILDGGTYDCQVVTTPNIDPVNAFIIINAPGAVFNNTANLELFDPTITFLQINAKELNAGGPAVIQVGASCEHHYNVNFAVGSIELNASNARLFLTADSLYNSTISAPDGSHMFVNILEAPTVTVLNPQNLLGRIAGESYPTSEGVFEIVETSTGTITGKVGTAYLLTRLGLDQQVNFPDNTSIPAPIKGDQIKILGVAANPWIAQFGPGVACFYGSVACLPGGTISSTNPTDLALFTYIQNNVWTVEYTNPNAVLTPSGA